MASYSLNQVAVNSAAVIGPALAGVLIASVGLFSCYAVDAITFARLDGADLVHVARCRPRANTRARG